MCMKEAIKLKIENKISLEIEKIERKKWEFQ
jgi:hypothetical protein